MRQRTEYNLTVLDLLDKPLSLLLAYVFSNLLKVCEGRSISLSSPIASTSSHDLHFALAHTSGLGTAVLENAKTSSEVERFSSALIFLSKASNILTKVATVSSSTYFAETSVLLSRVVYKDEKIISIFNGSYLDAKHYVERGDIKNLFVIGYDCLDIELQNNLENLQKQNSITMVKICLNP